MAQQQTGQVDREFLAAQALVEEKLRSASGASQGDAWALWMSIVPALKQLRLVASKNPEGWKQTEGRVLEWVNGAKTRFSKEQAEAFDSVWTSEGYAAQWSSLTQKTPRQSSSSQSSWQPARSGNINERTAAAAAANVEMDEAEISSDVEGTFSFPDDD